jgi:hypothetical protein
MLSALLLSLVFCTSIAAHSEHRIYHRIYHPLHKPTSFEPRGSIIISDQSAAFQPTETFSDDLRRFADSLQSLDGALYQVSLESEGDPIAGHWPFSSVKAVRSACTLHAQDQPSFPRSVIFFLPMQITSCSTLPRMKSHLLLITSSRLFPTTVLVRNSSSLLARSHSPRL